MGNQVNFNINNNLSQYYDQFGKFIADNADYTEILQNETYKVKKRSNLTSVTNSKAISWISLEIFSELLLTNKTTSNSIYHPLTLLRLNSNESGIDFLEYQTDNLSSMLQKFELSAKTKMQNIEEHLSSIEKDEKESTNKDESKKEINLSNNNVNNYNSHSQNLKAIWKKDLNLDNERNNEQKSMISFLGQTKNEKKNDLNYNSMMNILNKIDKIENEPKYTVKWNSPPESFVKTPKKGEINFGNIKYKFGNFFNVGFMKKGSSKTHKYHQLMKGSNSPISIKKSTHDIISWNNIRINSKKGLFISKGETQFNQCITQEELEIPVITFETNDDISTKNNKKLFQQEHNQTKGSHLPSKKSVKRLTSIGRNQQSTKNSRNGFQIQTTKSTQSNYRRFATNGTNVSKVRKNSEILCKKYYKLPKEIEEEEIIKKYCKPKNPNKFSIIIDLRNIPDDWVDQFDDSSNQFWEAPIHSFNNLIIKKIASAAPNESSDETFRSHKFKKNKINPNLPPTQFIKKTKTIKTQRKPVKMEISENFNNSDEMNPNVNNENNNNNQGIIRKTRRLSTPGFITSSKMSNKYITTLNKNQEEKDPLPKKYSFKSIESREWNQKENNENAHLKSGDQNEQYNWELFSEWVNRNNSTKMKFEKPEYNKKNPMNINIFKAWNEQKMKNKFWFLQTEEEKKWVENINLYHSQKNYKNKHK